MSRLSNLKEKLEGSLFKTSRYGELQILKYQDAKNVEVVFLNTGYTTIVQMSNIYKGKVKDRLQPTVHGIGIVGDSLCKVEKVMTKSYSYWESMLARCYSEIYIKKRPTYRDCTVSENFKYLPYFEDWCNSQVGFSEGGWALDKDILIKGNKIYSEESCCFVPLEINNLVVQQKSTRGDLFIGVAQIGGILPYRASLRNKILDRFDTPEEAFRTYKKAKEAYIREVANNWKGRIDNKVYDSLMNWEVGIDD